MKILTIMTCLVILTLPGFAQPDPAVYYAASRLDYYTSEEVGEILVYIPANLKEHKIAIDLVFEHESLNKGYPVLSTGISTVPFPMKRLREGQNEITVSFYEDGKWIDSRKVWVTIRPHRENAVKIDRAAGGLSVAGMPMVPFGFYTYFPVQPDLPEDEAVKGFNLISPYQEIERKTLRDRKAYMNHCADLGIRVNYNLCSVTGGGGVGNFRSERRSSQEKREMLRREIEMFRNHPALLAWYIAEEHDGQYLSPDSLLEVYSLIKELDPYHPVSLVLSSLKKAAEYRDVMDIVMMDAYPMPEGNLIEVKESAGMIKNIFWLQKPVWVVPRAFGSNEWLQREPTPGEIRSMTYLAIIQGATGIQYFIRCGPHSSFPKSAATWDECSAMALEIAELTPDILSPHPAPKLIPDDPYIHAKAWNRAGLVTIAVVNEKNEPVLFKLKMEDINITVETDVMFENRKLKISDGVLEDMIDGYGTRVYRFDARNKPDRVKGFIPGNLTIDPGFEDLTNVGVPSACHVDNGDATGNTYFIDSRRFFQGEHSLQLNNPSDKQGNRLSFYGTVPDVKKSYTVSVMARTGSSSNQPGGKKGGPVRFRLALGSAERTFDCTATWQKFEINALRASDPTAENNGITPQLEMAGKGTAWFDVLQVYPDMEMTERRGEEGKGRIVELTSIHPDVQIFYTIDGSEPSIESLPYLIPVEIEDSIIFRAAAFKDGVKVGFIER